MAKKAPKKPTNNVVKKKINTADLMKDVGLVQTTVKDKDLEWIPFNGGFYDAIGIPGVPKGHTTIFRGFSDTGKSTGIYESIAGAQKIGDYPVIIDTEGSFNWDHAKDIGMQFEHDTEEYVDEDTGEISTRTTNYRGDFMFFSGADLLRTFGNFDYTSGKEGTKQLRSEPVIEDIARLMNLIIDKQMAGDIEQDILFVWDSIGSLDCFRGATKGASNNQWTAGALNSAFKSILNYKIPSTRREDSPFTNTFVVVNKVWLDSSGMGQPVIKHSGGEGFKFGARLIIHMGGKTTSGASALKATTSVGKHKSREFQFGMLTKIEVAKNQVNGVTLKGKIASTSHGFWNPDKMEDYKKIHKDYIKDKLDTELDDFDIKVIDGINDNQSQE